jgi:hypothetical protein
MGDMERLHRGVFSPSCTVSYHMTEWDDNIHGACRHWLYLLPEEVWESLVLSYWLCAGYKKFIEEKIIEVELR